jgi:hypothetical protein
VIAVCRDEKHADLSGAVSPRGQVGYVSGDWRVLNRFLAFPG